MLLFVVIMLLTYVGVAHEKLHKTVAALLGGVVLVLLAVMIGAVYAVGRTGAIYDLRRDATLQRAYPKDDPSLDLNAIWGNSATDIYAVGNGTTVRFDGSGWYGETTSTPNLWSLWGAGGEIYASGKPGVFYKRGAAGWEPQAWLATSLIYGIHGSPAGLFLVGGDGAILRKDFP